MSYHWQPRQQRRLTGPLKPRLVTIVGVNWEYQDSHAKAMVRDARIPPAPDGAMTHFHKKIIQIKCPK
jgi:hypothetical protein